VPNANPGWSYGGGPGGSNERIGTAKSVFINVPAHVSEKLYVRVKEVTSSLPETVKCTGVPSAVVPLHSPA